MLKHVGRIANNKRKVVVAFRVVPGEPENCIVVTTENLEAADHDSLIKLVESAAGQESDELASAMGRTSLSDGSNMLARFHTTGKMVKVPTNTVEMIPNKNTIILLSDLNELIAQQKGVSVSDLAGGNASTEKVVAAISEASAVETTTVVSNDVLTDEQLAAQYRSQADSLYKEAKRLREQAEELAPTKKKTVKTAESA